MSYLDFSISRKLGSAFAIVMGVFLAVILCMMWLLGAIDVANGNMRAAGEVNSIAHDMMVDVIEQENAIRAYTAFGDSEFVTVYREKKDAFAKDAAKFQETSRVPEQRERAADFARQIETWQKNVMEPVIALAAKPETRSEAQRMANRKTLEEARVVMKAIYDNQTTRMAEVSGAMDKAGDTASMALIAGGVIAVLTSTFFGIMLGRVIGKPLTRMTTAMAELANGNMQADIPTQQRKDEVGKLSEAMLTFRTQMREIEESKQAQVGIIVGSVGAGLEALSNGDLTYRIDADLTGPFAKLKTDYNLAMDSVGNALIAVNQSTSGIRTGSNEISQASDDLSRRTEQQAASLEETAAAMDEITATVRETATNAMRANEVVAATRSDAEDGGRVVRKAVDAMGGIERASSEISEIISVIDGIAFQTNLLALNAGVEAARAGDAGRGFAVVASEVRALAQRSADAAKDVKTKITASAGQVEIGVDLVAETGQALERIVARIAEVSQLVSGIASSAEQQAAGLQQVNTAVGEMDSVTQQNAAMVEESNAAARSLSAEAEDLARHVARFRIAVGTSRAQPSVQAQAPARAPARPAPAAPRKIVARRPSGAGPQTSGALALAVEPDADDWSRF